MGCCGSKEEVTAIEGDVETMQSLGRDAEGGVDAALETCVNAREPCVHDPVCMSAFADTAPRANRRARINFTIDEESAVKAKPGNGTFLSTVLKARDQAADNAEVMTDCASRLQAYNRRIKEYIALYDCQAVNEAMNGGFMGLGCNDNKLIAAVCTRTKSQLQRTRKQYRDMYDKDMRAEVQSETGGSYQRLMYFALASRSEYVADIIDLACHAGVLELGCDETALLEIFVTRTKAELQEGKVVWEGRTDKSLVDFLTGELGSSYRHLKTLLCTLYMGDRDESGEADPDVAAEQAAALHAECEKGWFEDFEESLIIDTIGKNSTAQNVALANEYEKAHHESLRKALEGKCGDRLHYALCALLLGKSDFLAMRLHDAMAGWFNDKDLLTRLLGGLDGEAMAGVAEAYETKYSRPLWSALKAEIDGDFHLAASTWLSSLDEQRGGGAEAYTEVDVDSHGDSAEALAEMVDYLLVEKCATAHRAVCWSLALSPTEPQSPCEPSVSLSLPHAPCSLTRGPSLSLPHAPCSLTRGPSLSLPHAPCSLTHGLWCSPTWNSDNLLGRIARLDVESVREATKGFGTDDTGLIRAIATRSKRMLARVNAGYRAAYDDSLQSLIEGEMSGWYAYLAKLLHGTHTLSC